ncbi:MAG: hypothetical protein JNJ88_16030 [Planctomycetes bacterium]|nr:hypothetical protein [Planctomycetota bacterium]
MSAEQHSQQILAALASTQRARVAMRIGLLRELFDFAQLLPDKPMDALLGSPGVESMEEVLGQFHESRSREFEWERRQQTVQGAVLESARILRETLRAIIENLTQQELGSETIRQAERRLRSRELKIRVHSPDSIPTSALLMEGSERAWVSGMNVLGTLYDRAGLSLLVSDPEAVKALGEWYSSLWARAHGVEEALVMEMQVSWPIRETTPFEIYALILASMLEPFREGGEELGFSHSLFGLLTEFQKDAVREAAAMIDRHNGCFVADVVGLGKTYVGAALAKYFEWTRGWRALILAPPQLREIWQQQIDLWEIHGKVISTGLLTGASTFAPAFRLESPELQDRDFVIVDESHNFRNGDTQRYHLLSTFLSTGRKVCLLTATPLNSRPDDIYHQLKLFHPTDRTHLPIQPPRLEDYFRLATQNQVNLRDLLRHVLIRRTRRDILRDYGRDWETGERINPLEVRAYASGLKRGYFDMGGKRQCFPRRDLQTVAYSIERTYAGLYNNIRDIIAPSVQGVAGIRYARYSLATYIRPECRDNYRANLWTILQVHRGLMRVLLFKRLESSVDAFLATLRRIKQRTESLLRAIQRTRSGILDLSSPSEDAPDSAGYEPLAADSIPVRLEDLEVDELAEDLIHDLHEIARVEGMVSGIAGETNDKLQTLMRLMESPALADKKVILFTQFEETARLLHRTMVGLRGADLVDLCTGSSGGKDTVIARFAPRANKHLLSRSRGLETQVLVATDVLSEGVNLQDCSVVVNYDLHWNPVRLIQRFGRIDRLGSEHDRILAMNFLPESELERNLGLQQKLRARIEEIHRVIGEDSAVLEPGEQLNEESLYSIYQGNRLSDEDLLGEAEDEDLQQSLAKLSALRADNPAVLQMLRKLPLGQRSARLSRDRAGVLTLLGAGEEMRFYWVSPNGSPIVRDLQSALRICRCEETEERAEWPAWAGDGIESARDAFWSEILRREGGRRLRTRYRVGQREIIDQLEKLEEELQAGGDLQRVQELLEMLRGDLPDAFIRELRVVARRRLQGAEFLEVLAGLVMSHQLNLRSRERQQRASRPTVRVIASLALVT